MKTLHCKSLGACEICGNCCEKNHPWYYCGYHNDNFGNIDYPNECDDYTELEEDDDDDDYYDDDEEDDDMPIECPSCGSDAYWNGSEYECDQCGWCGN